MPRQIEMWPGSNRPFQRNPEYHLTTPQSEVTVRLAFIHKRHIALLRYKNTPWYGLPGGNFEEHEMKSGKNLLERRYSFPTLTRELLEECDLQLTTKQVERSHFVGLSNYTTVNDSLKLTSNFHSLIWGLVLTGKKRDKEVLQKLESNPDIYFFDLHGHAGQQAIFPDARETIAALKDPAAPQNLGGFLGNEKGWLWFQMSPTIHPLVGAPIWAKTIPTGENLALIDKP